MCHLVNGSVNEPVAMEVNQSGPERSDARSIKPYATTSRSALEVDSVASNVR